MFHTTQSRGDHTGIPGLDYVAGASLADIKPVIWQKHESESILSYAARLSSKVHSSTYHCNPADYTLSFLESAVYAGFRRFQPTTNFAWDEGLLVMDKALCGFCHQRAYFLSKILTSNDVPARPYGVNGHVVVIFQAEGQQWLVDPDYDVAPFLYDVSSEALFEMALQLYRPASWSNEASVAKMISSKHDNGYYNSVAGLRSAEDAQAVIFKYADYAAYAILVLGSLCILFFAVMGRRQRGLKRLY